MKQSEIEETPSPIARLGASHDTEQEPIFIFLTRIRQTGTERGGRRVRETPPPLVGEGTLHMLMKPLVPTQNFSRKAKMTFSRLPSRASRGVAGLQKLRNSKSERTVNFLKMLV